MCNNTAVNDSHQLYRIHNLHVSDSTPQECTDKYHKPTLWMCQVGEVCGGGDRDGVEGSLGHGWLRAPWRTLGSHQHHRRVGGCRVVRLYYARLHMGLGVSERVCVSVCV